ncbi:MAG TPA: hypothetical protein VNZ45_04230, partial [Bacteroidia bacterium]|nr:hypothetical protein [Bacteroidia bacterium]
MHNTKQDIKIASVLLRVGLAVVLLYAAISSIRHPLLWVGFLPTFLTEKISATTLIKIFAIYELILAGWLISGKYLKYCAILSALTFGGIVITNISQLITT